jgi:hypothetical protein
MEVDGMSGKRYRFRRFDSRNFAIEEACGQDGRFRVMGYYGSPEAMCRAALRYGIGGDSVGELLLTVEAACAKVVEALHTAIAGGTLQLDARSPKAREKRTTTAQPADPAAPGAKGR